MASKVKKDTTVQKVEVSDEDLVVKKVDKGGKDKSFEEQEDVYTTAIRIIKSFFVIVEILLFLKFSLEFLEANPESLFYKFMVAATSPFMFPFQKLFSRYELVVFNESMNELFAMFVYFLLVVMVLQIIRTFRPTQNED